ncbi:hypothetical protein BGX20_006730, partial [Mortierella sp. AD010]
REYFEQIKDEVVRITNCVPRELVNLSKEIGTSQLTPKQVEDVMGEYQSQRDAFFYESVKGHYEGLGDVSKGDTRQALTNIFLPRKDAPRGAFDWKFEDFGIVYRHKVNSSLRYHPITPAARKALLRLYTTIPLPEAYRNNMTRNCLSPTEFEDALFQQFIRGSSIVLKTTDLAGNKPLDVCLNISGYELMQKPPRMLGAKGMGILIRGYEGYERFDFILGYTFIQVSISSFTRHNSGSADIDNAFEREDVDAKNQIEEYLDATYGGVHKANMIKTARAKGQYTKKFEVTKDGEPIDFKIVYMHGRNDKSNSPNHTTKVNEYPEIRHICYDEIKSK